MPIDRDEVDFIAGHLAKLTQDGIGLNSVCLVARTNEYLHQYEGALKAKGLQTYFVKRSVADDRKAVCLRMATMHIVKGLKFVHVIVAGCNDGVIPLQASKTSCDPEEIEDNEILERALFHVAMTRAKKRFFVELSGKRVDFRMNICQGALGKMWQISCLRRNEVNNTTFVR